MAAPFVFAGLIKVTSRFGLTRKPIPRKTLPFLLQWKAIPLKLIVFPIGGNLQVLGVLRTEGILLNALKTCLKQVAVATKEPQKPLTPTMGP